MLGFYLVEDKTVDTSNYDMVEVNSQNISNASNNADEDINDENNVVQNPYYDGDDNIGQSSTAINVMENPYYGGVENDADENKVNVVDNPYYGGIDDSSDSDDNVEETAQDKTSIGPD